jgi:hypothetical protein
MMLAPIRVNEPDEHCLQGATVLADSGCDLGDEAACMAVLQAAGVDRGRSSLMCMRIAAHNIRTQRLIVARSPLRLTERRDA